MISTIYQFRPILHLGGFRYEHYDYSENSENHLGIWYPETEAYCCTCPPSQVSHIFISRWVPNSCGTSGLRASGRSLNGESLSRYSLQEYTGSAMRRRALIKSGHDASPILVGLSIAIFYMGSSPFPGVFGDTFFVRQRFAYKYFIISQCENLTK